MKCQKTAAGATLQRGESTAATTEQKMVTIYVFGGSAWAKRAGGPEVRFSLLEAEGMEGVVSSGCCFLSDGVHKKTK